MLLDLLTPNRETPKPAATGVAEAESDTVDNSFMAGILPDLGSIDPMLLGTGGVGLLPDLDTMIEAGQGLLQQGQELLGGFDPQMVGTGGFPLLTGIVGEGNEEAVAEEMQPTTFSTAAINVFPTVDAEGDGYVTAEDIDRAMSNPDLTPDQAAAVATMKSLREELEELSNDEWGDENDGITMEDLLAYQRTGQIPQELRDRVEGRMGFSQQRIANASTELFANGTPDVNSIQQGSIGDCYFLAAVGSLAAQNPQAIVDMIATNQDGTYTVTFPNGRSATVPAPTSAEIAYYGTSGGNGMWLTLLERAYGQIRNEDAWFSSTSPQDEADGGALLSEGTSLFSTDGSDNMDFTAFTGEDTTAARLESAFAEGRVVTAGIRGNMPFTSDRTEGLPMGHAYSVVGYDPATRTVTLRNPWGRTEWTGADGQRNDGANDGTFTMTVEEFDRVFTNISYANARPTR